MLKKGQYALCNQKEYKIGKVGDDWVNIGVGRQKDGKLLIGIGDAELANLLGLERTDKYFYEKWVPLEDVQLIEEKKPSIL